MGGSTSRPRDRDLAERGPSWREFNAWVERVKALEDWNRRLTFAVLGVFMLVIGSIVTALVRMLF